MKKKTLRAASAALLAVAACGGDVLDVGSFAVDGRWEGTVKRAVTTSAGTDTARYTFVLDLEQSGRNVSGSGVVQTPAETLQVDVEGRWDYPSVDLRLSADEFAPVFFDGSFATPDSLKGPLTGSGLDGLSLNLLRDRTP